VLVRWLAGCVALGHPAAGRDNLLVRQRRCMRNRFLVGISGLVAVLALVGSLAGWFLYRQLRSSNLFQVTRIEVQGNRAVLRQQIIETAGLHGRQVLFDVDRKALQEKLEGHPWIKNARVERRWPATITIAVAERRPLALVNMAGRGGSRLYYLDGDGVAFAPVLASQDIDFPLLSGVGEDVERDGGRVAPGSPAVEGLHLLRLSLGDPILPIQAISEIHYDAEQGFILYLADKPFPIYLGQGGMRGKFRRLTAVLKDLYRRDSLEQVTNIRLDSMEQSVLVAQREQSSWEGVR